MADISDRCYNGGRVNPIDKEFIKQGADGFRYKIEISVETHEDTDRYPEGVKAVFKMIRLDVGEENKTELVVLVDNHRPFGFHSHDELPENHDDRTELHIDNYKEAWTIFQGKCKEILNA